MRNGESAFFAYLNHGKRIVTLDCGSAEGWELLVALAAKANLVIAEAAGLAKASPRWRDASVWPRRPATVAVSPGGLGGPDADRLSSPFVVQHSSGIAFHQASPVTDPETTPPVGTADWEGGLATGLMVALSAMWANEAGKGARPAPVVDMSHQDALVYLLVEAFADWQAGADVGDRRRDPAKGLTIAGGLVWYLPCADGSVMVSPREDHQWQRWCEVMGHPSWTKDATLCGDRVVRTGNAAKLQELMAQWSVTQPSGDVVAAAQAARVACFLVSKPIDLLNNAQLKHRQFFSELKFADGQSIPVAGLPFRYMTQSGDVLARGNPIDAPGAAGAAADLLAEHQP